MNSSVVCTRETGMGESWWWSMDVCLSFTYDGVQASGLAHAIRNSTTFRRHQGLLSTLIPPDELSLAFIRVYLMIQPSMELQPFKGTIWPITVLQPNSQEVCSPHQLTVFRYTEGEGYGLLPAELRSFNSSDSPLCAAAVKLPAGVRPSPGNTEYRPRNWLMYCQ